MHKPNGSSIQYHPSNRVYERRRGTAIVNTTKGILVTSDRGGLFLLPGGAANKHESRMAAAIRELKEETNLAAYSARFLFEHTGSVHRYGSKLVKDYHKVFLIEAEGKPRPCREVREIDYYQPGDAINLSKATQRIIEIYFAMNV